MNNIDEIKTIIINALKNTYRTYELKDVCRRYGLNVDDNLSSKAEIIKSGLMDLTDGEIEKLAAKIEVEFRDATLIKELSPYLGDSNLKFSFISRNALVTYLEQKQNMEGKIRLEKFIEKFLPGNTYMDLYPKVFPNIPTKAEVLSYYIKATNQMTYRDLLMDELEIMYFPDNKFIEFLEYLVSPEVRTDDEQTQYVQAINAIIEDDGYELVLNSSKVSFRYYKIQKKNLVSGNLKNLIFAPTGAIKKPDIVIENSINNELSLANDTSNCLMYNFNPGMDGLKLSDLIEWWKESTSMSENKDIEKDLYMRLRDSLDSKPEKIFLYVYFKYYRNKEKKDVPALIPQVQLHYDPRTIKQRGGKPLYNRQRMDFLMLLPGGRNIVFEIDGKEHYSKDGKPSPQIYSEMVKADRELKLKGYDVYRFGGYELCADDAGTMLCSFFDKFFKKYNISF